MHSILGTGNFRATELGPTSDLQVAQTMRIMGDRATEDAANPIFQAFAGRVFDGVDSSDTPEIINRAYGHVRNAIRFQRDEESGAGLGALAPDDLVEFIVRPVDMARYVDQGIAIGDCDDFSMYLSALLATQGIPTKFCTVAVDDRAPDQFSHVYVVAYVDGQRIPLDASHGDFAGWEVEQERPIHRKQEWSSSGGCSLVSIGVIVAAAYLGYKALEAA